MAKRKKENQENEEIIKNLTVDPEYIDDTVEKSDSTSEEVVNQDSVTIKEDNPFSKKVIAEIDKVSHNKNNEILSDSDLIGNIIL